MIYLCSINWANCGILVLRVLVHEVLIFGDPVLGALFFKELVLSITVSGPGSLLKTMPNLASFVPMLLIISLFPSLRQQMIQWDRWHELDYASKMQTQNKLRYNKLYVATVFCALYPNFACLHYLHFTILWLYI